MALIFLITMLTLLVWLGHIGEYRLRPSRLGAIPPSPVRPAASGVQDGIAPNLSGLRRYSPIRPRQTTPLYYPKMIRNDARRLQTPKVIKN